jgi:hypothetical protein
MKKLLPILLVILSSATPPNLLFAETRTQTLLFEQPILNGVQGNFYVPIAEKRGYPKSPPFKLLFWQANPFQDNGELVPSTWGAKIKTGLDVGADQNAQYSLKSFEPSSTVQIKGGAVGAYINSTDLMNSPYRVKHSMMITPVFDVDAASIFPFADSRQKLYQSLKLRIPLAVSQSRPKNIAYVVSDFVFTDRTTGAKITYEVALFHGNPRAPQLTREGLMATEVGPFDVDSHSYQVRNPLTPLSRLMTPAVGSALFSAQPWHEKRTIAFTISWQNFKTALQSLKSKTSFSGSLDPADYSWRHWHLNAEVQFDEVPVELGWSLSDTKITLIRDVP